MEDFNWTHDQGNKRYICEKDDATMVVMYDDYLIKRWFILSKDRPAPVMAMTTKYSISYAQGQAEGAYLGLKATGRI